jgi:hypothetical protein
MREYQSWFTGAMEAFAEDSKACQQHLMRTGFQLTPKSEARQGDERRTG